MQQNEAATYNLIRNANDARTSYHEGDEKNVRLKDHLPIFIDTSYFIPCSRLHEVIILIFLMIVNHDATKNSKESKKDVKSGVH